MSTQLSNNNYISRINLNGYSNHIYHDNIILFGPDELSKLILPGLLNELKDRTKHPEFLPNNIPTHYRYNLPSYINVDAFIRQIRTTLADILVFINTWIQENKDKDHDHDVSCGILLHHNFETYEEFFDTAFAVITSMEKDPNINELTCELRSEYRKISQYLGSYHGNLKEYVYDKQMVTFVVYIILYIKFTHRYNTTM